MLIEKPRETPIIPKFFVKVNINKWKQIKKCWIPSIRINLLWLIIDISNEINNDVKKDEIIEIEEFRNIMYMNSGTNDASIAGIILKNTKKSFEYCEFGFSNDSEPS